MCLHVKQSSVGTVFKKSFPLIQFAHLGENEAFPPVHLMDCCAFRQLMYAAAVPTSIDVATVLCRRSTHSAVPGVDCGRCVYFPPDGPDVTGRRSHR